IFRFSMIANTLEHFANVRQAAQNRDFGLFANFRASGPGFEKNRAAARHDNFLVDSLRQQCWLLQIHRKWHRIAIRAVFKNWFGKHRYREQWHMVGSRIQLRFFDLISHLDESVILRHRWLYREMESSRERLVLRNENRPIS